MATRRVRSLSEVPPELMRESTDNITSLVRERLPSFWDRRAGIEAIAWPAVATAFLARAVSILESLTTLVERGRGADAQILMRVLLEHATVFCWIAIDSETNLAEWRAWDDWRRKKLHNDALAYGVEVLTSEELAEIGNPPRPKDIAQLAVAVDKYWSENHSGFRPDGILSIRGLYPAIYRKASTLVHPTQAGVERHMRLAANQLSVVADEQSPDPPDLPAVSVALVSFMLLAYGSRFDWPEEAVTRQIADLLIYEDAD